MNTKHVEYRVFGPPGTGKTARLSTQIARAAESKGSDGVLVASFTKAAATELAGRNLPVNRENVGTLHALCYRQLGRPTIAETQIDEWNEDVPPAYRFSGGDVDLDEPSTDRVHDTPSNALFEHYQILRARMIPEAAWPQSVRDFATRWQVWKENHDYADFTDLIDLTYRAGAPPPGAPAVGFFDEVQDFTALELALVRRWAQHLEYVVLAGDDDQTIYTFKGATPDTFLAGEPDQKVILDQSYRVPRAVQAKAEAWIKQVARREPKVYRPRDEEGEVRRLNGGTRNPEPLIADIERQLAAGRTVMVLASCSYLLRPVIAVLRHAGMLYHNPYCRVSGEWNPLTPGKGLSTAARLLAYLRPDRAVWGDEARVWTPQDLKAWTGLLRSEGVLKRGAKAQIERMGGHEEVGDEILALFEGAVIDGACSLSLDWLEASAGVAKAQALTFPLAIARKHGAAKLREQPRVCIGTIHSVKGGEADTVYLLPDLSRSGMEEWMYGGERRDAIRRQFYVGMTRARHSIVLCAPASHNAVSL